MRSQRRQLWRAALTPFILCVAIAWLTPMSLAASQEKHADSEPQLDQAIHDYIIAHPEVLLESLRMAKNREDTEKRAAASASIPTFQKELLSDPISPVLGNPKGDIAVVEFFDYRCPYCRQVDPLLRSLSKDDQGVRIIQKQLPILGPESVVAARAALAANMQGKLAEFHTALMTRKLNFTEANITDLASGLGLDVERLKADMASPVVEKEISRNLQLAKALNINGTPGFVVGSQVVPGATDLQTLKDLVEDARREAKN
jgi:protein-disulfide isomerase